MFIFHKLLIFILFCFLVFFGCATKLNLNSNENFIINNHVQLYAKSTNSQNDDISAILREFSSFVYTNKFISWNDLITKEDSFMLNLKSNYISQYYTIIASDEEIQISDNFLDSIISNDMRYNPEWINEISSRIPMVTSKFITHLNDYEYNKRIEK